MICNKALKITNKNIIYAQIDSDYLEDEEADYEVINYAKL